MCHREKADIVGLSGLITPSLDEMVFNCKQFQKAGLTIPVLVGGATTSKMHTAVKLEQCYTNNAVIHVLDASRSVVVVQKLLDPDNGEDYKKEIREEYAELRKEYYDSQKDKTFVSLAKARAKAPRTEIKPVKPTILGTQVFKEYDLKKLLPFIDWILSSKLGKSEENIQIERIPRSLMIRLLVSRPRSYSTMLKKC